MTLEPNQWKKEPWNKVSKFITQNIELHILTKIPIAIYFSSGVETLVHHFHSCGVPIAVATGSSTGNYNMKIEKHGELFKLFSHVVKSDDPELKHGKPAPDIFLLAASRFQPPPASPDRVLVFEDAPNGVAAASAAGMKVVMVPDQNVDRSLCAKADVVLKSLEEFDPAVWGFPPCESNKQ